jgi:hypothetical protein
LKQSAVAYLNLIGRCRHGAVVAEVTSIDLHAAVKGGLPSDVALAGMAQDVGAAVVHHHGFRMDPASSSSPLTREVLAVHAKALWTDNHHTGQAQIPNVPHEEPCPGGMVDPPPRMSVWPLYCWRRNDCMEASLYRQQPTRG